MFFFDVLLYIELFKAITITGRNPSSDLPRCQIYFYKKVRYIEMYEIALCDDDTVFSSTLENQLYEIMRAKGASCHLSVFSSTASLWDSIINGNDYDLVFLDILFDEEKGIRFAKFLREREYPADIVFITIAPEYAVSSYDTAPLHYLVKPVKQEKLKTAVDRFLEKNTRHNLLFTIPAGTLQIPITDILFIEIYAHDIIIHKTNNTKEVCTGTLKKLEGILPSFTFVRPHRSYLVNLEYISEITRYQIRLASGDTIPVSKELYQQVQGRFIDYAEKRCFFV